MSKKNLLILVFLFFSYFIFAQNKNKLLRKAEKEFYSEKFKTAQNIYFEILSLDPINRTALYRSELCSLLTKYPNKSVDLLIKFENDLTEKDRFFQYWLGKIYKAQGNFKEAEKSWSQFLALDLYKSPLIVLETQSLIDETTSVIKNISLPINYQIEKLDLLINSNFDRLSPTYIKSSNSLLFFSSDESLNSKYQLYEAQYKNGEWSTPKILDQLGVFNKNDAGIGLVEKTDKTFIYGDLYYVNYKNSEWSERKTTAKESAESHIYINSNETKILFSAKTQGAVNNLDLFMVTLDKENVWGQPQRFGNQINTHFDEAYPFLSEDENTLYFSSKGHGTRGGFDIYKSTFNADSNTWSNAFNLNQPINSKGDEIYFKIDEKTNSGFLNSNRFGVNSPHAVLLFHDIYNINLLGKVIDQDGNPIVNAPVSIYSSNYITRKLNLVSNEKGEFNATVGNNNQLNIEIAINQNTIHKEQFKIKENEENQTVEVSKVFKVTLPKEGIPSTTNPTFVYSDKEYSDIDELNNKFRMSKKALLGHVYFGYNKFELTETSSEELNQLIELLNKNSDMRVEIAGHTDNIGSDNNNLILSKKRAESVVKYLVSKGIKNNRLVAKGYGETRPLASNDDLINGRELNRRIEVMVIE